LRDGGELRLATDHRDYLGWMLERLSGHPDFEWTARGPDDWRRRPADWPATRYERKSLEEGRNPAFLRYIRRPRGAAEESGRDLTGRPQPVADKGLARPGGRA
jgi:tRNA (guanine-N7-)-methyltransferase